VKPFYQSISFDCLKLSQKRIAIIVRTIAGIKVVRILKSALPNMIS
jgi:hypothetical protein